MAPEYPVAVIADALETGLQCGFRVRLPRIAGPRQHLSSNSVSAFVFRTFALELALLRDIPQSQRKKNGFAVRIPDRHQGPGGVDAGAIPAQ